MPAAGSGGVGGGGRVTPRPRSNRWRGLRSSISVTIEAARSSSSATSRGDQIRGRVSTTQSAPTVRPSPWVNGTPA